MGLNEQGHTHTHKKNTHTKLNSIKYYGLELVFDVRIVKVSQSFLFVFFILLHTVSLIVSVFFFSRNSCQVPNIILPLCFARTITLNPPHKNSFSSFVLTIAHEFFFYFVVVVEQSACIMNLKTEWPIHNSKLIHFIVLLI